MIKAKTDDRMAKLGWGERLGFGVGDLVQAHWQSTGKNPERSQSPVRTGFRKGRITTCNG